LKMQPSVDPIVPSLIIKIDPEAPRSWDVILAEARRFIECKAHPSEDLIPWPLRRQLPFKRPNEREIFRFIHFGGDHTQPDTPSLPNDVLVATDHLRRLPYELKAIIMRYTIAPIELEAGLRTPLSKRDDRTSSDKNLDHEYYKRCGSSFPRLIILPSSMPPVHLQIYGYRSWNHIPFYYVDHAWRDIAIDIYGQPTESGIPFDRSTDSVRISAQPELAAIFNPNDNGSIVERRFERWFDQESRVQSRNVKEDSVVAHRRLGSKHGVKVTPNQKMIWGKAAFLRLDSNFMTRVRKLVLDIRFAVHVKDKDCQYKLSCPMWRLLIDMATKFFTETTHVRVDTLEFDHCQCLYSYREARSEVFPNNAEPLSERVAVYNPPELWFFDCLDTAAAEKSHLGERLFPHVEHFEVHKTETFCTAYFWKMWKKPFVTAFHAGKIPTLLKDGLGIRTPYKDPQVDESEFDGPWYAAGVPQFFIPNA
jgi:hypothetical protein